MQYERTDKGQATAHGTRFISAVEHNSPWVTRYLPGCSAGTLGDDTGTKSATGQIPGAGSGWSKARPPFGRVVPGTDMGVRTTGNGLEADRRKGERPEVMLQAELARKLEQVTERHRSADAYERDADWQASTADVRRLQAELARELERSAGGPASSR